MRCVERKRVNWQAVRGLNGGLCETRCRVTGSSGARQARYGGGDGAEGGERSSSIPRRAVHGPPTLSTNLTIVHARK